MCVCVFVCVWCIYINQINLRTAAVSLFESSSAQLRSNEDFDFSCTWAHDIRFHIAGTNEPKSAQQAKQGASY